MEVGHDLFGEAVYVGDLVRLTDDAVGVDEVSDSLRQCGVLVVGCPGYLVLGADRPIDVGKEVKREAFGRGERLVVFRGIERCAEDDGTGSGEVGGPVTQALSLDRSASGRGFGIPPEQHPVAALVGK